MTFKSDAPRGIRALHFYDGSLSYQYVRLGTHLSAIRKAGRKIRPAFSSIRVSTVQERYDLGTAALLVRCKESIVSITVGNTVFYSPSYGIGIPGAAAHIIKSVAGGNPTGDPTARYRKVTISARLHFTSGAKVVALP